MRKWGTPGKGNMATGSGQREKAACTAAWAGRARPLGCLAGCVNPAREQRRGESCLVVHTPTCPHNHTDQHKINLQHLLQGSVSLQRFGANKTHKQRNRKPSERKGNGYSRFSMALWHFKRNPQTPALLLGMADFSLTNPHLALLPRVALKV